VFSDYGWAGEWDGFDMTSGYTSAGIGFSILDGLIRADAAYGFDQAGDFRLDLYLDGML
jgi:hypothetical protein